MGCDVRKLTDATQAGPVTKNAMKKCRRELLDMIDQHGRTNTAVILAFMGHGVEYDGQQYLLPQDWDDDDPRALVDEAMSLQETLAQIEAKKPLVTLAFLDCCREHASVRGGVFGAGGLGALKGPSGSLVMYATGQGMLAADAGGVQQMLAPAVAPGGQSRNGAFTAALLKHIATPGLTLEQLAVEVVQDVEESTNGAQTPEHVSRLKKAGLCLVPAAQ